jgi:hypothetical protein
MNDGIVGTENHKNCNFDVKYVASVFLKLVIFFYLFFFGGAGI